MPGGVTHICFSNDQGETWTADDIDLNGNAVAGWPQTAPSGFGDAAATFDEAWLYLLDDGTILCHLVLEKWLTSFYGTYQTQSTDNGITWTTPSKITFTGAADSNLIRSCNQAFISGGTIYAVAERKTSPEACVFITSADSGVSWSQVSVVGTGVTEIGIEYLGNSNILALLRSTPMISAYQNASSNMGTSWGSLVEVTWQDMQGLIRPRVRTAAHIRGEANWWTDTHLIAWGATYIGGLRRNAVWLSKNSGVRWYGFYVDSSDVDGGYGDMFYNSNTGEYVLVGGMGKDADAVGAHDIKQYNFTVNWGT